MFPTALYVIAQAENNPNAHQQLGKLCYIPTRDYCSAAGRGARRIQGRHRQRPEQSCLKKPHREAHWFTWTSYSMWATKPDTVTGWLEQQSSGGCPLPGPGRVRPLAGALLLAGKGVLTCWRALCVPLLIRSPVRSYCTGPHHQDLI